MNDLASKAYLTAPLPHAHDDKRAAAHEYLKRRRISLLLPKAQCKLEYVPSENGSRILNAFRDRASKATPR